MIVSGSDNISRATLFECSHGGDGRSAFAGASRDSSAHSSEARLSGEGWDDEADGGLGVREPRRPLQPSLTGAAALDLPQDNDSG